MIHTIFVSNIESNALVMTIYHTDWSVLVRLTISSFGELAISFWYGITPIFYFFRGRFYKIHLFVFLCILYFSTEHYFRYNKQFCIDSPTSSNLVSAVLNIAFLDIFLYMFYCFGIYLNEANGLIINISFNRRFYIVYSKFWFNSISSMNVNNGFTSEGFLGWHNIWTVHG